MSMIDERDRLIDTLIDREAIREVLYRYCRGADRHDEMILRSVYHSDATDNHGSFKGRAADFVSWIMERGGASFLAGQHLIGNVLINLDGDTADVESVFIA